MGSDAVTDSSSALSCTFLSLCTRISGLLGGQLWTREHLLILTAVLSQPRQGELVLPLLLCGDN